MEHVGGDERRPGDGRSTVNRPTDEVVEATTDWFVPDDFGAAAAVQNVGTVAAPLLAGFSFTLLTFVVQDPARFAMPDWTLLLLVGAGIAMIFAVQFGAWARQHESRPGDYREWWKDADRDPALAEEQRKSALEHALWARRTRNMYNLGVLLLLGAVALLLWPPNDSVDLGSPRGWAFVVAALGLLGELSWLVQVKHRSRRERRQPDIS